MAHVLDNPVWNALTGRQKDISLGTGLARRYLSDISTWATVADDSPEALDELAFLVPPGGTVILARAEGRPFASTGRLIATPFVGLQMIADKVTAPEPSDEVIDLTDADGPEMLELATVTKPGPFIARTHVMGDFIGIRKNGRLVAMAGERFKLDGFAEVSVVCTHPDWRGRGYASLLSRVAAARIKARGETAFLHAFITNGAAIRLYEQLGFVARTRMDGAVYRRA